MKDVKERVSQMEAIYHKEKELVEKVKEALLALREHQEDYESLKAYYGSDTWHEDRDHDDEKSLGIPCGVLSEDLVYELIGEHYHLAINMLEEATEMLKNY